MNHQPENKNPIVEKIKDSSIAAKAVGVLDETIGNIKVKFGEWLREPRLKEEGRNQIFKGKVEYFVGVIREIRDFFLRLFQRMVDFFKRIF